MKTIFAVILLSVLVGTTYFKRNVGNFLNEELPGAYLHSIKERDFKNSVNSLDTLTIKPDFITSLTPQQHIAFSALFPDSLSNKDLSWIILKDSKPIKSLGTISETGMYQAPSLIPRYEDFVIRVFQRNNPQNFAEAIVSLHP